MFRRLITAAATAVLAFAIAPAAVASAAPTTPRTVSGVHNGQHIVMHRDSQVQVMLSACETCGFSWQVLRRPAAAVARYTGAASTGSPTCVPNPCVGGNSNEFLSFAATGFGQTSVRLGYRGPGTTGVTRTLTLQLVVVRHARSAAAYLHLVRSGDTLYRVARSALGSALTPARLTAMVHRLYHDNREVIGANPDLLLPGEMLLVDPTRI